MRWRVWHNMMGKVWQQGAPEVAHRPGVHLEGQCLQLRVMCDRRERREGLGDNVSWHQVRE